MFNTPQFVLTFLAILIIWMIVPNRYKKPLLLVLNYMFLYFWGGLGSTIILASVTAITYIYGFVLMRSTQRKPVLITFISILVIILIYGKYTVNLLAFFSKYIATVDLNIPIIGMIGVSYYVFSAISYIVDIYNEKDSVDTNVLDVAIWMSFFAKIIAGPIERHNSFKEQLAGLQNYRFEIETVKRGLLTCSLGYFYKLVIADRLGMFVDNVYTNLDQTFGLSLLLTMFMYSLQIYFDFCGYSLIAYGLSYLMGLRICKNFEHPYFSENATEFWRRWHISLSSWLKDYVYIPLGGNRKGKTRQYLNLLITFLISGMWHGYGLGYIAWGGLHGVYQVAEKMIGKRLRLPRAIRVLLCFGLVSFAWIFFRAGSLREALLFIGHMFRWSPVVFTGQSGIGVSDTVVLAVSLLLAFVIEMIQMKGISLYNMLNKRNIVIRWGAYYLIIVALVVFGIYGSKYDSSSFIYFKY